VGLPAPTHPDGEKNIVNDEDQVQSDETLEDIETTEAPPEGVEEETVELSLEERLTEAEALAAEYLDGWQRARAELANFRKRIERERAQWNDIVIIEVVNLFLPAIDDIERALESLPPEVEDEPWLDGIRLIYRKHLATLEVLGVTEIESEGLSFDPVIHEAITHEESDDHEEGQIIGVVQKGYILNDKVIRPARVRVAS
jgi:molecular chaperone GrpE